MGRRPGSVGVRPPAPSVPAEGSGGFLLRFFFFRAEQATRRPPPAPRLLAPPRAEGCSAPRPNKQRGQSQQPTRHASCSPTRIDQDRAACGRRVSAPVAIRAPPVTHGPGFRTTFWAKGAANAGGRRPLKTGTLGRPPQSEHAKPTDSPTDTTPPPPFHSNQPPREPACRLPGARAQQAEGHRGRF